MQVPPGYALWIASAIRKAVDAARSSASGRFKDPLQADRALREGHADLVGVVRGQIADADFAAKARAGKASGIRICLSCNQECVGPHGPEPLARLHREPAHRARRRRGPRRPSGAPPAVMVVGAGAGGHAGGHRRRPGRPPGRPSTRRPRSPGARCGSRPRVPSRAEFGDLIRNQVAEAERLGVRFHFGVRVDAAVGGPAAARRRGGGHRLGARATVVGRRAPTGWSTSATCWRAGCRPPGRVLVVDELGFHQATSVAELLADRGCAVEIVTPGMVVGQDLGITLDLETWWMKATAKGIVQTTDTMVTAVSAGSTRTGALR